MNRVLKILGLTVGILLVLILPMLGYFLIDKKSSWEYPAYDESLIIGERQAQAVKEGKMIQGLVYDRIEHIDGTATYLLPVSARPFNNAKEIEEFYKEFEDVRSRAGDVDFSGMYGDANIIFLDSTYDVVNVLLQKKAFISTYRSPYAPYDNRKKIDPSIQNILYLIAFDDTNKNGMLDGNDEQNLYISKIDGSELKQVTHNIEVIDFEFTDNNSQVFLTYVKRDGLSDEHKHKRFAKYHIRNETLIEFVDLHRKILELEKKLMIDTVDSQ
jgi:hypothetical protein